MPESLKTRGFRWMMNCWPCYRSSGGRVQYIADDFSCVRIKVLRDLRTRNYVGTIFGGSMFGAVDPVYMLMLLRRLGPDYMVWVKSADVRFLRPAKRPLYAEFVVDDAECTAIRDDLRSKRSITREYRVRLADQDGTVYFEMVQHVYIRAKDRAAASGASAA